MIGKLPPLSALRVFEATARHLHFTRAAEELGMTQAAVSYQIKLLEERIGAPLFQRLPRQVTLTETGRRLAPGIIEAFEMMRVAVAASRERARTQLSITSMQSFASGWLAHRLGGFQMRHPDIAVRLDINQELTDFAREPFDVGIRYGKGNWSGLDAHKILNARFTVLMAPSLAETVHEPADLLQINRLEPEDTWWDSWFRAAGLSASKATLAADLSFDSQTLVGHAAISGVGAAMLTPAFFTNELARGLLVQPFDLVCTQGQGYYLVYPHARRNAPHIAAFREWILAEAHPQVDGLPTGITES